MTDSHEANSNGVACCPEESETGAILTHQQRTDSSREESRRPVAGGLGKRQRNSKCSSASSSAEGTGSKIASQKAAIVKSESALGGGLPRGASQHKIPQDKAFQQTLKWNKKRCGTSALVEKAKEAFLLQMAVDTRKAEILKLHDKAAQKSEALRKAESVLSQDAQKFDEFLRTSDAAAHEATRKADDAARAAQEKAVAVRQLRQKLDATKALVASNQEKVEEYSRYRAFLAHITPQEWLKDQEEQSREHMQKQKQEWVQQQFQQQQQQYATDVEAIDDDLREKLQELEEKELRGSKASNAIRKDLEEKAAKRKKQLDRRLKTASEFEEAFDAEKLAVTCMELYFKDPQEPLRLFKELEEENLFLIQNAHENVIELEAMEKRFAAARTEMGARLEGLEAVIAELQQQLEQQRDKCKQHREELALQEQESDSFIALQKLTAYVAAIHAACGFEKEGSVDCLRMLEQIEARLDSHLAVLAKHEVENPDLVYQLEKAKEKQRRERTRQKKLAQQHFKSNERLQLSLRQSSETARKRASRPIAFRSKPFQKRKEVSLKPEEESEAVLDYKLYFQ